MEFNPNNTVIQLCLQGMNLEDQQDSETASKSFLKAWLAATNYFEKFTAAWFVARQQHTVSSRLQWLQTSLQFAQKIDDHGVQAAYPALHSNIAKCYEELGDTGNAKKHEELALAHKNNPQDEGPFYHGTRADLQPGDLLTPGYRSNYHQDIIMNHIYFTAVTHGAALAAALAHGDGPERVYMVKPTGNFENDPNVTDKKFPGNPTRSYRTSSPLKVVGEASDWVRLTAEELQQWREKLARNKGEIIN